MDIVSFLAIRVLEKRATSLPLNKKDILKQKIKEKQNKTNSFTRDKLRE